MSRIFISHSSANDDWALAIQDWLDQQGWSGDDNVFLDIDPERGIAAGQRWRQAFEAAVTRCEAVLFLVSEAWLKSKWCADEYQLAVQHNKPLFALLLDDISYDRLPGGMTSQWQFVSLRGEPARRFVTVHPKTQQQSPIHIREAALVSLKRGLEKAGISPSTFELQEDPASPTGWRMPFRGLEALEAEDAAVFFGRDHDIVRGLDAMRGMAAKPPPRLLVILGASGAGKSSFLRAGLWPRLLRDDARWLPLMPIRAGRGGAIEGAEGLLASLEDVHRRFGLRVSRADLRAALAAPGTFLDLVRRLRRAAAERALLAEPPYPLPVLCLDQAEELFAADAGEETRRLLAFARAAMEANEALVLATIRSDSYGVMQTAPAFAGIHQDTFSLGPAGDIERIIREPAEVLRRKVGLASPVFDAEVIATLREEVKGEPDALPLLAFVLERLMRENAASPTIGRAELERTGGVSAAIEAAAQAALRDAGVKPDRAEEAAVLRRLFIPRLARIDRDSKAAQRRPAPLGSVPQDLLRLARALTERRLLVTRAAAVEHAEQASGEGTLEVAHEALLRRWPRLAELLAEDRDALLLLDATLLAAADWGKADPRRKADFLAHRGSRLQDARALAGRGPEWANLIAPARDYLDSCETRERADRARAVRSARWIRVWSVAASLLFAVSLGAAWLVSKRSDELALEKAAAERERDNARTQTSRAEATTRSAQITQSQFLANLARKAVQEGDAGAGVLLALEALPDARHEVPAQRTRPYEPEAEFALNDALQGFREKLLLLGHTAPITSVAVAADGYRIATGSADSTARVWDAVSGAELLTLKGHTGGISSVAVTADGGRIVTGSLDNTARVWDAASGAELLTLAV